MKAQIENKYKMSVQPAALYWADPCISDTWPTGLLHLAWNTQPLNGFAFNTNTTNTNTNGTILRIQIQMVQIHIVQLRIQIQRDCCRWHGRTT